MLTNKNILKRIMFIIGISLLICSLARFWKTVQIGMMYEGGPITANGEMLRNFPMFPVLKGFNPALFEEVKNSCLPWFTNYSDCKLKSLTSLFNSAKNGCNTWFASDLSCNIFSGKCSQHNWKHEVSNWKLRERLSEPLVLGEYYSTSHGSDDDKSGLLTSSFGCSLPSYNPTLYEHFKNTSTIWFTTGNEKKMQWFYGPFYHFVHLPILLFSSSLAFFLNSLFVFYVVTMFFVLYLFSRYYFDNNKNLVTIFIFAFTLGQFAFLENLKQRNIEITEFILICIAILAVKFKKQLLLGASLSLAFLSKLLPFIFFPYLIIKKHYKSISIYLLIVVIVSVVAEFVLGWRNWHMLEGAFNHGVPSGAALMGDKPLAIINHTKGSFYTFILVFFSEINLTETDTLVSYNREYLGLINWGFLVFCTLISIVSLFYIYNNKSDILFDFALITSLMLLVFPRTNPHYYMFSLFGIYYLLQVFLCGQKDITSMGTNYKYFLSFWFVVASVFTGEFIPFSIFDKIFNLNAPFFHYYAAYGIQGLGIFILWLLLLIVGPENTKTNVSHVK
jgi:hypothetical protein